MAKPRDTRDRLLEAAGEAFAERGFHAVAIRDICAKAEANIAAVNYHFGDKDGLYRAVIRYAHDCVVAAAELRDQLQVALPPEQKLDFFVRTMVRGLLDSGRPAWHGKLISREMVDPGPALDELVELEIRPKFAMLRGIVGELLGLDADDPRVRWYAAGVLAQCLFFHHNKAVTVRLYPDVTFSSAQIERLADHIVRFTLVGLRGEAERLRRERAPEAGP